MFTNKPIYLILYKNENWKTEFIKKRLVRFINDLETNTENELDFKYFNVRFMKASRLEKARGFRVFGIIIEDSVEISDEQIRDILVGFIDNPFIGAVHRMK